MAYQRTSNSAPMGSITIYRVVSVFDNVIENYQAWKSARQTEAILRGLSESQLEDIGLTIGDIPQIARATK